MEDALEMLPCGSLRDPTVARSLYTSARPSEYLGDVPHPAALHTLRSTSEMCHPSGQNLSLRIHSSQLYLVRPGRPHLLS